VKRADAKVFYPPTPGRSANVTASSVTAMRCSFCEFKPKNSKFKAAVRFGEHGDDSGRKNCDGDPRGVVVRQHTRPRAFAGVAGDGRRGDGRGAHGGFGGHQPGTRSGQISALAARKSTRL